MSSEYIPYGHQWIDEEDIASVVQVLRSAWLTTGPKVPEFEQAFAARVGSEHAVAVSSGTAALHSAVYALGIGPGDEVVVPAMTFAATANCIVAQGGVPIFADVDAQTLLLTGESARSRLSSKTRAIIAVDYAGQPCNYPELRTVATDHSLALLSDSCHSLGASCFGKPVGQLTDLATFSFHPVKNITTGEGGMITTQNADWAGRMRAFRNHGVTEDSHSREKLNSWFYEMVDLGYNYRLTDFQCALGISQLGKLEGWIKRRKEIAGRYDSAFSECAHVSPLVVRPEISHAHHLYVVRLKSSEDHEVDRGEVFRRLRLEGIGVNVHYIPVHLHPYYRLRFGTGPGLCPEAEAAYTEILTLPIFPSMRDAEVDRVVSALLDAVS